MNLSDLKVKSFFVQPTGVEFRFDAADVVVNMESEDFHKQMDELVESYPNVSSWTSSIDASNLELIVRVKGIVNMAAAAKFM